MKLKDMTQGQKQAERYIVIGAVCGKYARDAECKDVDGFVQFAGEVFGQYMDTTDEHKLDVIFMDLASYANGLYEGMLRSRLAQLEELLTRLYGDWLNHGK